MDREEVTKWLSIMKANLNSFPEVSKAKKIEALAEAIRLLKNEQSKEPREGHWVIKDNMWWVCSACGCQTRMMKKYNVPNFCPACGAKMVEPQESEDKG